jgi:hypothetical protein
MIDLPVIPVDPPELPPALEAIGFVSMQLIDDLEIHEPSCSTTCVDIWEGQDEATWSPGLWWLLNWWTWAFPAPWINIEVIAPEPPVWLGDNPGVVYQVDVVLDEPSDAPRLGPALADLGDKKDEPPPPPQLREVIEQRVIRGTGLLDLLA